MGHRIVFMGTPAFSVPTLRRIVEAGHDVPVVYTQPPRPAGRRGLSQTPSPVAVEAERLGLRVRHPVSLKGEDEQRAFAGIEADVAVVVAYGLILPRPVLQAPRFGALNGHASLLPRWRGAAPIQRAIEAGDVQTGVMAMRMEEGLDTGPVAGTRRLAIGPSDTAGDLHDHLSLLCAEAMADALDELAAGTIAFETQDSIAAREGRETLYARKIDKAETRIDFSSDAAAIARRINAFSPFPGAWTGMELAGGSERLKLLRAVPFEGQGQPGTLIGDDLTIACGTGAVRLLEVQRAGGRVMSAAEFMRGLGPRSDIRFA